MSCAKRVTLGLCLFTPELHLGPTSEYSLFAREPSRNPDLGSVSKLAKPGRAGLPVIDK